MKTVTICGSMQFSEEMKSIALELELYHGWNVLQCVYNPQNIDISDAQKEALANAHFKKIDLSDAIYVVDVDGYVGESVKQEMAYARTKGKEVIFHSQYNRGIPNEIHN